MTAAAAPGGAGSTTRIRWLGEGQVYCHTSSAASQFEPWCQNPSEPAGWGNWEAQREARGVTLELALPRLQLFLPGGTCNVGLRRCSWAQRPWRPEVINGSSRATSLLSLFPYSRGDTAQNIAWFTHWGGFARWKSWGGWTRSQPSSSSRMTSVWVYEIQVKGVETRNVVSFVFHSPLPLLIHFISAPLPTYILAGEMYAHQLHLVAKYFKCCYNWIHFALNMLNALSLFYSLNMF